MKVGLQQTKKEQTKEALNQDMGECGEKDEMSQVRDREGSK